MLSLREGGGQEGGACFNTVKLCERFETGGTERISFWMMGGGEEACGCCEALGLVVGDQAWVGRGLCSESGTLICV